MVVGKTLTLTTLLCGIKAITGKSKQKPLNCSLKTLAKTVDKKQYFILERMIDICASIRDFKDTGMVVFITPSI